MKITIILHCPDCQSKLDENSVISKRARNKKSFFYRGTVQVQQSSAITTGAATAIDIPAVNPRAGTIRIYWNLTVENSTVPRTGRDSRCGKVLFYERELNNVHPERRKHD
jgi:hypothetical protein